MGSAGRFIVSLVVIMVVGLLAIFAIGSAIGALASINKTGPTTVAVIRNGGPFDNKDIREVRPPSQSVKVSGIWSEVRDYIAGNENRFYKVSSDPSLGQESGADFIQVPTKDGVNVEVDAQITFRTDFTDEAGTLLTPCNAAVDCAGYDLLVEKFDTAYGNRNFTSKTGGSHKVWEGNDGWNAFLDSIFRPVVENAFREQIGAINCSDLVSSCALVQSSVAGQEANNIKFTPKDNSANFEHIQDTVQHKIESGVKEALGSEYLTGFKVQLTKVTLPGSVQKAIDEAQSNFAQIAEARARKEQAQYQAEANEILSKSYRNNPTLGFIKAVESVSKNSNATIILGQPGTGFTLGK